MSKQMLELEKLEYAIRQITDKYPITQISNSKSLRTVRLELSKLMSSWLYELLKHLDVETDNDISITLINNVRLRTEGNMGFTRFYHYEEFWEMAYNMFNNATIEEIQDEVKDMKESIKQYTEYLKKLERLKPLLVVEGL